MTEKPTKHGLTVLQWLGIAAIIGIALTVLLNYAR